MPASLPAILETVVLDTSALLYWIFDQAVLTQPAKDAIGNADQLLVSSISIWEIGLKAGKGKLDIPLSAQQISERLLKTDRVEIVSVDTAIWLRSLELSWSHRDPADRVIVALADLNQASLVTSDQEMNRFYQSTIW